MSFEKRRPIANDVPREVESVVLDDAAQGSAQPSALERGSRKATAASLLSGYFLAVRRHSR